MVQASHNTRSRVWLAEEGAVAVSTSDIEGCFKDVPAPEAALVRQALGRDSFLGSSGPAGRKGLFGKNPWNPESWQRSEASSVTSRRLAAELGATSSLGPITLQVMEHARAAVKGTSLQAGDVLGLGGPDGLQSPRGAFGAAGPVGAHGLGRDENGQYVDEQKRVVRQIEIKEPNGKRTRVDLVEHYKSNFAMGLPNNDATWLVRGVVKEQTDAEGGKALRGSTNHLRAAASYGDAFPFQVPHNQWITLVVVPERREDNFRLTLTDGDGNYIASSSSRTLINAIQMQVPAGLELRAVVEYLGKEPGERSSPISSMVDFWTRPIVSGFSAIFGTHEKAEPGAYRLFSVGSEEDSKPATSYGPHQSRLVWLPSATCDRNASAIATRRE